MADRCNSLGTLTVRDNDRNYLIVESPAMRIDFRKSDGLMTRYDVNGKALLNEGAALEPDFWRAPTDNDFGAKLNEENRVWEHPGLRLLKLEHGVEKGIAVVTARYDMEKIDAVLTLEYRLNNAGEITVREQLTAGERTDVPDMMRFGMRMRMPAAYDRIDYYGRGPWENYADRKDAALLGRYRQTVDEQFYPYIRPQETGTKSDVRRWRQSDITGRGIEVVASEPFSASALNYSREALDEGLTKKQGHSQEIEPDRAVWLTIEKNSVGWAASTLGDNIRSQNTGFRTKIIHSNSKSLRAYDETIPSFSTLSCSHPVQSRPIVQKELYQSDMHRRRKGFARRRYVHL